VRKKDFRCGLRKAWLPPCARTALQVGYAPWKPSTTGFRAFLLSVIAVCNCGNACKLWSSSRMNQTGRAPGLPWFMVRKHQHVEPHADKWPLSLAELRRAGE